MSHQQGSHQQGSHQQSPPGGRAGATRCAALIGPYQSGKTSLLESLLFATGSIPRKGSVKEGASVGDSTAEARDRGMSVEINLADFDYLGDHWSILDCPGSVELLSETKAALMVADVAVIVTEADPDKAVILSPIFRFLNDHGIPHLLFINKIDALGDRHIRDVVAAYQTVSSRRLVLREVPIRDGGRVTGFVDLVSERAWAFNPHKPSDLVALPDQMRDREETARQEMMEAMADHDDQLLEKLLEDVRPETTELYTRLAQELADSLIVPVFFGSAENDNGVRRLLKALRHETPLADMAAARLDLPAEEPLVQIFKTIHGGHTGKLGLARLWRGSLAENASLGGERIAGLYRVFGGEVKKRSSAQAGDIVAVGRLEKAATGDLLTSTDNLGPGPDWPERPSPLHSIALHATNRNDEVKLTAALQKLIEEDPALSLESTSGDLILGGQGDIHLKIAMERLRSRHNVAVTGTTPPIPYRETIRQGTSHHARFKRQSGGHGQFADIQIEVRPLERGEGILFEDAVVGGTVPRSYIPAVEAGVREHAACGPLGFQLVDFAVKLTGGQHHAVDSSEMAFRTVAKQALTECLPLCEPVLLEPILNVTITLPAEFTSKAQRLISARRGQILGYDARPGWPGWDEVRACLPQAEMRDLIIDLRSATQGVGSFTCSFDRLQEITGKQAEKAVEDWRDARAAS